MGSEVRWIEVPGGEVAARFTAGDARVLGVAFDATGDLLAAGCEDGTVRVWHAATSAVLHTLALPAAAETVAVQTNRVAASARDGTLRCWNLGAGAPELSLHVRGRRARRVAFSPDGATLATGHEDGSVALWDAASGDRRATLAGHRAPIASLEFTGDGEQILSSSYDGTWRVWDAQPGDDAVLGSHRDIVRNLAFHPEGSALAAACFDGRLKLYDLASRALLHEIAVGGETEVQCAAWAPRGDRVFLGTGDGRIRVVDPRVGETVAEWQAPSPTAIFTVAPHPDVWWLATGNLADLTVWDVETRQPVFHAPGPKKIFRMWAAAFSPDGRVLAGTGMDPAAKSYRVRLFRSGDWTTLRDLPHPEIVVFLAFSADGSLLATAARDDVVRVWDVATGACRFTLPSVRPGVECVAISPDGRRLAAAAGPDAELWDLATGERLLTLRGPGAPMYAVAWSPDGRTLAAGCGDHSGAGSAILLWGPAAGQPWPPVLAPD